MLGALRAKGVATQRVAALGEARGRILIIAGVAGKGGPAEEVLAARHVALPHKPESLVVSKTKYHEKAAWVMCGGDDCGLMYAELDAADRIGWSHDPAAPLSELRETVEAPSISNRGVTIFTMNRAYWESRFYDEAYWTRYLDMLAQQRFNRVILIFGYENGGFLAPCYPYFFDTAGYPDVRMIGITPEQQQRNLDALNRLIKMSHDRGFKFTVGIWDHIYRFNVQGGGSPGASEALKHPTLGLVWGMNGDNLVSYTKASLAHFLKIVPNIDSIQFRMHDESGLKPAEQEGFWREIFALMKQEAPQIKLDLRAKGLPDSVIQNCVDTGLNFEISTKCWMEQMGLPFHPTHINVRDQSNRRHGYADLLRYPQEYKMNWQLWNGGTARILLWGDPDFARRFVESTHLYDGDSFEIDEPLATKMEGQPHDAMPFELLGPQYRYYNYEFERYWHYLQVFGRIGYNEEASPEIWDREFARRFGREAGRSIEDGIHSASWILPRIVASDYPYGDFPMTAGWAEKQRLGDLASFAKAEGSDIAQFENFDEEAARLIERGETAKVRPQETSHWFAKKAAEVSTDVAEAERRIGEHRNKEFDSTIVDLKILANLALYHSRRIPAAVDYRLFVRTRDPRALDDAIAAERGAVEAWRQLVASAGDVYAPDLMMGARSRNLCGHWRDELASLEKGLAALEAERAAVKSTALQSAPRYEPFVEAARPTIVHAPVTSAQPGRPLVIDAEVRAPAGIQWVRLRYRSVNQYLDYQTLPMLATGNVGHYEATVPGNQIPATWDFMYYFEVMDKQGRRGDLSGFE